MDYFPVTARPCTVYFMFSGSGDCARGEHTDARSMLINKLVKRHQMTASLHPTLLTHHPPSLIHGPSLEII